MQQYAELVGYSEKAWRRKIEDGVWVQGKHWRKSEDGRIWADIAGIERWVEGD